jgi:APA family basic amino acid/polyamine antiporter
VLIIVLFSFVHYHSLIFGAQVQNILTVFKITLITIFVGAGFFVGHGSVEHFFGHVKIGSVLQEKFAVSLIFVSFAYSGWNAAAYLGGEIKKPGKNIPLALFAGTLIVTCLYLLLNALYIYALSPQEMSGVLEVGASSAEALFGSRLGGWFTGAIALGLLSVLSAMIMAGPRVYYAMARDGVFFELFGQVNKSHRTPAHAIFLQSAIAILMVLTASFEKLLIYIGFTLSLCAALTVIGMVKLRKRQPGLQREYKTLGYPVTPLIFILGNLWIIYFSIKSQPTASLVGLGTIGLGLIVFCYFRRMAAAQA